MSFISESQLRRFHAGVSLANENIAVAQILAKATNSSEAQTTIFLSHSHKDRHLIEPVASFLRSHGVKLYVDWTDGEMPDVVSGETARKLKDRIRQFKKFIVLVTENSKSSRWVPWELGYADSQKGMDHIASFPIADGYDFTDNEYLKIYPKVYYVSNTYYIWQDDPTKLVELKDWLRR